ncbi:GFA family protein [Phenylobacterium sp.]|uniref:GFA family protein n=1 Tax=Phenylobacterium sp. TaxID=1871053 RepID=UPI00272FAC0E|nr:GFA family protein [Phenylobacterium sp.]MDP1616411.1 GFA family protein [Phenylobacterium sp.]MDP1986070.1 GFA family protein [Phenylobacterium sp.]
MRVAVCHCLACQRQTGSTYNVAGFFSQADMTASGEATIYTRRSDSGHDVTLRFCPDCGSTLWWTSSSAPEWVAVAVGAFADPQFPAPTLEVWGEHRHPWVTIPKPD